MINWDELIFVKLILLCNVISIELVKISVCWSIIIKISGIIKDLYFNVGLYRGRGMMLLVVLDVNLLIFVVVFIVLVIVVFKLVVIVI